MESSISQSPKSKCGIITAVISLGSVLIVAGLVLIPVFGPSDTDSGCGNCEYSSSSKVGNATGFYIGIGVLVTGALILFSGVGLIFICDTSCCRRREPHPGSLRAVLAEMRSRAAAVQHTIDNEPNCEGPPQQSIAEDTTSWHFANGSEEITWQLGDGTAAPQVVPFGIVIETRPIHDQNVVGYDRNPTEPAGDILYDC